MSATAGKGGKRTLNTARPSLGTYLWWWRSFIAVSADAPNCDCRGPAGVAFGNLRRWQISRKTGSEESPMKTKLSSGLAALVLVSATAASARDVTTPEAVTAALPGFTLSETDEAAVRDLVAKFADSWKRRTASRPLRRGCFTSLSCGCTSIR